MAARNKSINLLSKNELEVTPIGRVLKWALSFGKYIVIFTQIVVIAAFIYRFKLDPDLDTVNDTIAQQQQVIISYQDLEQQARILHGQLEVLRTLTDKYLKLGLALETVNRNTPLEVEVKSMAVSTNGITLEGKSLTEIGLATLVAKLQEETIIKDVVVNTISTGGAKDPTLSFIVSAVTQMPEKNKESNGL
jgi:Tfp pilus assembly protein PilN